MKGKGENGREGAFLLIKASPEPPSDEMRKRRRRSAGMLAAQPRRCEIHRVV